MSEFKGTKDTWILDKEGYIKTKEGFTIADFFIMSEQDLANATLASKAPEMLEMLNKVLEINKTHNFNGHLINEQIAQLIKEATEL